MIKSSIQLRKRPYKGKDLYPVLYTVEGVGYNNGKNQEHHSRIDNGRDHLLLIKRLMPAFVEDVGANDA